MVSNQKHRRIANYREQLSVLWQFGCLSLGIHKIKKRIIVQNVNQRLYVYFKWTLKSSFCFHTKDRKWDVLVHCLFYPLFLHPCNWTFPLSHSHSAIYFLLNSSYHCITFGKIPWKGNAPPKQHFSLLLGDSSSIPNQIAGLYWQ